MRYAMILKEKFTASGEYDRLKTRLVHAAIGNQQDNEFYEDLYLSSTTMSTTSVLAVAAIAASDAPRVVTQVQKIFSGVIIFIKKVAFLLGLFTPLGIGLVHFLRNRSEAQVGTALRLMLVKASSRTFDCIDLRYDGEGAIGALTSALRASGIFVTIAGPGQYVAVLGRMARKRKDR
jgi:hypothetical protein